MYKNQTIWLTLTLGTFHSLYNSPPCAGSSYEQWTLFLDSSSTFLCNSPNVPRSYRILKPERVFTKNSSAKPSNSKRLQDTWASCSTDTRQQWTYPWPSVRCAGTWPGGGTTRCSAVTAARASSRGTAPSQTSSSAARVGCARWTGGAGPCVNTADSRSVSEWAWPSMGSSQSAPTPSKCPSLHTPMSFNRKCFKNTVIF